MTERDRALLQYLEFSLIGLVETLKPHLREDVNIEEVYDIAEAVHSDIRDTISQPSGLREGQGCG